jgi:hypothetical protein
MKLTKKHVLSGLVTFAMVLAMFVPALMLTTTVGAVSSPTPSTYETGNWDLGTFGGEAGLGTEALPQVISGIIAVILSTLGVIAVLIILWGGFLWMTAAGEPDKVDKAKKLIVSGIIGLVIIFAAYAIASFVLGAVQTSTGVE